MRIKPVTMFKRQNWLEKGMVWVSLMIVYLPVYADDDPMTKSANWMGGILFGGFGLGLCSLILAGTFIMAKTGKVSWERFIGIGICVCGFFGSPVIVSKLANLATS